jgi:hypothetical protein
MEDTSMEGEAGEITAPDFADTVALASDISVMMKLSKAR